MKKCTYCGKEYPDGTAVCPIDEHPLRAIVTQAAGPDPSPAGAVTGPGSSPRPVWVSPIMSAGRPSSLLFAVIGAFCGYTIAYTFCAVLVRFFQAHAQANDVPGEGILTYSLQALYVSGGVAVGYKLRGLGRRILLVLLALALCYWIFAPNSWWIH